MTTCPQGTTTPTLTAAAYFINAPTAITIQFPEAINGTQLAATDIIVSNGAACCLEQLGKHRDTEGKGDKGLRKTYPNQQDTSSINEYQVSIVPNTHHQGTLTVYLPYAATTGYSTGLPTLKSNTLTFSHDSEPPEVHISAPSITNIDVITLLFHFSESIQRFDKTHLNVNNGQLIDVIALDATSWQATVDVISHNDQDTVVSIQLTSKVVDLSGNHIRSKLITVQVDKSRPSGHSTCELISYLAATPRTRSSSSLYNDNLSLKHTGKQREENEDLDFVTIEPQEEEDELQLVYNNQRLAVLFTVAFSEECYGITRDKVQRVISSTGSGNSSLLLSVSDGPRSYTILMSVPRGFPSSTQLTALQILPNMCVDAAGNPNQPVLNHFDPKTPVPVVRCFSCEDALAMGITGASSSSPTCIRCLIHWPHEVTQFDCSSVQFSRSQDMENDHMTTSMDNHNSVVSPNLNMNLDTSKTKLSHPGLRLKSKGFQNTRDNHFSGISKITPKHREQAFVNLINFQEDNGIYNVQHQPITPIPVTRKCDLVIQNTVWEVELDIGVQQSANSFSDRELFVVIPTGSATNQLGYQNIQYSTHVLTHSYQHYVSLKQTLQQRQTASSAVEQTFINPSIIRKVGKSFDKYTSIASIQAKQHGRSTVDNATDEDGSATHNKRGGRYTSLDWFSFTAADAENGALPKERIMEPQLFDELLGNTATPTSTITLTPSLTVSSSVSETVSSTFTVSSSRTPSFTFTISRDVTKTLPPILTGTFSETDSLTPRLTTTLTPTSLPTSTHTTTATHTTQPTATATTMTFTMDKPPTETLSTTNTATAFFLGSVTHTSTITTSSSHTTTDALKLTPTLTTSQSGTIDHTSSHSSEITASITTSMTDTLTLPLLPTMTMTDTATKEITNSESYTATTTDSRTSSASATGYPTITQQDTLSASLTGTVLDTLSSTHSQTVTPTVMATSTINETLTFTASVSTSPTPTHTISTSPTGTTTATLLPHITETKSSSISNTDSLTVSEVAAITNTATYSQTPTLYFTGTLSTTPTYSSTGSPVPTASATEISTPTITDLPTFSFSGSPSPTGKPTDTVSRLISPSSTQTQTESQIGTSTLTQFATPSFTVSATPTQKRTFTHSFTQLPTFSRSQTNSFSLLGTATHTETESVSLALTWSSSLTASSTASRMPTVSYTSSPTMTLSAAVTASVHPTQTLTENTTLTGTASRSESPTNTNTVSFTPTTTMTGTWSYAPTNTFSFNHSQSFTMAHTTTHTHTATLPPPPTLTFSLTDTLSNSLIPTHSMSVHVTATSTESVVPTITATENSTLSTTASRSVSVTPTETISFTPSVTLTFTTTTTILPTYQPTVSLTATPSLDLTATSSLYSTVTVSSTLTDTASLTPSEHLTQTRTPNATATEIYVTQTQQQSATITSTDLPTPTFRPTQTDTVTWITVPPNITETLSGTPSSTHTAERTLSVDPKPTLTATLPPTQTLDATDTITMPPTITESYTLTPTLPPTTTQYSNSLTIQPEATSSITFEATNTFTVVPTVSVTLNTITPAQPVTLTQTRTATIIDITQTMDPPPTDTFTLSPTLTFSGTPPAFAAIFWVVDEKGLPVEFIRNPTDGGFILQDGGLVLQPTAVLTIEGGDANDFIASFGSRIVAQRDPTIYVRPGDILAIKSLPANQHPPILVTEPAATILDLVQLVERAVKKAYHNPANLNDPEKSTIVWEVPTENPPDVVYVQATDDPDLLIPVRVVTVSEEIVVEEATSSDFIVSDGKDIVSQPDPLVLIARDKPFTILLDDTNDIAVALTSVLSNTPLAFLVGGSTNNPNEGSSNSTLPISMEWDVSQHVTTDGNDNVAYLQAQGDTALAVPINIIDFFDGPVGGPIRVRDPREDSLDLRIPTIYAQIPFSFAFVANLPIDGDDRWGLVKAKSRLENIYRNFRQASNRRLPVDQSLYQSNHPVCSTATIEEEKRGSDALFLYPYDSTSTLMSIRHIFPTGGVYYICYRFAESTRWQNVKEPLRVTGASAFSISPTVVIPTETFSITIYGLNLETSDSVTIMRAADCQFAAQVSSQQISQIGDIRAEYLSDDIVVWLYEDSLPIDGSYAVCYFSTSIGKWYKIGNQILAITRTAPSGPDIRGAAPALSDTRNLAFLILLLVLLLLCCICIILLCCWLRKKRKDEAEAARQPHKEPHPPGWLPFLDVVLRDTKSDECQVDLEGTGIYADPSKDTAEQTGSSSNSSTCAFEDPVKGAGLELDRTALNMDDPLDDNKKVLYELETKTIGMDALEVAAHETQTVSDPTTPTKGGRSSGALIHKSAWLIPTSSYLPQWERSDTTHNNQLIKGSSYPLEEQHDRLFYPTINPLNDLKGKDDSNVYGSTMRYLDEPPAQDIEASLVLTYPHFPIDESSKSQTQTPTKTPTMGGERGWPAAPLKSAYKESNRTHQQQLNNPNPSVIALGDLSFGAVSVATVNNEIIASPQRPTTIFREPTARSSPFTQQPTSAGQASSYTNPLIPPPRPSPSILDYGGTAPALTRFTTSTTSSIVPLREQSPSGGTTYNTNPLVAPAQLLHHHPPSHMTSPHSHHSTSSNQPTSFRM